jgi:endo-1,4-beta-mannosidase
MAGATRDQAWVWTNTITSAIRQADPDRNVLSDMHSLKCENESWRIVDQAELNDILTTHPYPHFTPKCGQDQLNTIRNGLQATVESRFYGDIGNRPCVPEELGTLGPVVCSEKVAAAYIRTTLFSSWAHDCRGLLWWCAYDQGNLDFPPYEWTGLERELGLFRNNRQSKPVCDAMSAFGEILKKLPFKQLPERRKNAVCILTRDQDQWGVAFGSFILAKMAGFDIEFQFVDQPLKKSDFYLVPSVAGLFTLYRSEWLAILDQVHGGATMLLSYDNAFLQPFENVFGLEVESREKTLIPEGFKIDDKNLTCMHTDVMLKIKCTSAEIMLADIKNNPLLTCNKYGKGKTMFLNAPLENFLSNTPGVFNRSDEKPYWKIYAMAAKVAGVKRIIVSRNPQVGVTEHFISGEEAIAVLINYNPEPAVVTPEIGQGWSIVEIIYGQSTDAKLNIGGNDGAVVRLVKKV